jgi:AcrR family transcriptional regulator
MEVEPRSKETLVKQFREETLTEAARKIMNSEGYAGLTIERVAEAAGVSKGTIYLYFKNKEDLLHATVASTFANLITTVRHGTSRATDFEGKLRALVTSQLSAFAENLTFLRALFVDQHFRPHTKCEDGRADVIALHREFVHFVATILESGRAEGRVRADVDCEEIAFLLVHTLQGIGIRHALGFATEPPGSEAEINRILLFIEHGIGRQGA